MNLQRVFLRSSLLCGFFLSSILVPASHGQAPVRVVEAVDDARRVTLRGNVHPLARAEFDRGAAPADLRLDRMLLVLKHSDEQEQALKKLLDDQQDRTSPQYHHWLTPEQFAQQFSPAEEDVQKVAAWLTGKGFQNVRPSRGRAVIEFSGSAAQMEPAFGTSIHKYVVNEEEHWANSADPQIPAALWPVVAGVFTLHDFHARPTLHVTEESFPAKAVPGGKPQFTSSTGLHALGPSDYYTIYNISPFQSGASAKIAIVGRSNINLQDVAYFHQWMNDQAISPQVIVNGPDPGDSGGGEETEAVLDTTWAGSVAPTAGVYLIVSQSTNTTDGVDLSELYIVDNNQWDVMSESFGNCEGNFTSAQATGIASLAQQAAVQGITYAVAAGDSGSAGCDDPHTETVATHPPSVNLLASNPYVVAVGGTMFHEGATSSTYWSSTNTQSTLESALSYIPEVVWNESCLSTQTGCSKPGIWAGGGGASVFFSKPSWQSGVAGIPSDNARDLPDVSLTAAGHDPYLLCIRGSCVPDSLGRIRFAGISGTSAATPAFAGIMALAGQKTQVRLGQANYVLYRLAAAEDLTKCNASVTPLPAGTCIFNDVTVGNNSVPGEAGYGTSSAKYQSGTGYDLATGLGSVNVTNLVNQWTSVAFSPTNTAFTLSPTTAVHGSAVNVTVNVTPNSGTAVPGGVVWLVQNGFPKGNFTGDNTADILPLNAQGSFNGVTHLLPGGSYQVNAHYAGDGTYAGSNAAAPINVTIQPEPTTLTFSVLTVDAGGNFVPLTSGPYGSTVYYKAHVSGQSGYGTPTASVNFYDTGGIGAGGAPVDQNGDAQTLAMTQIPAGNHSITASYYGDNSFSSSSNLTPVNFMIGQLATTTTLTSQQNAQSVLLTATVSATGTGSGPSGTLTLSSGSTVLGTIGLSVGTSSGGTTQSTGTFDATQLAAGQYSVTASYGGDTNYTASKSAALNLNLAADFSVANRGIASQTVVAGGTASYINDIGVTPFFGFSSTVSLSCSVAAAATTCTVNPTTITGAIGIATVNVTTTSRSTVASIPVARFGRYGDATPWNSLFALALVLLFFVVTQKGRLRPAGFLALAALIVFLGLQLAGCGGGGGSSGPPPPPPQTGTPVGSYTVTVSGMAGGTTHTTTLTLIVQ